MGTRSIPLQLVGDDEFQALEVAIAAAESSASSAKKPKMSPSSANPICTVSAILCETRIPESGYYSGFTNGLSKGACRFVEIPSAQAPNKLASPVHSEALNASAESGASCVGSLHGSKEEEAFSAPASARFSETIAADGGEYLQGVFRYIHPFVFEGGPCSNVSREEAFLKTQDAGYACAHDCEASNADSNSLVLHPNITDKLLESSCSSHSEYSLENSHRQSRSSRRRLPSWQCPAGSHQHETLRSLGPIEIKERIRQANENRPASNLDSPEALSVDNTRLPWGLTPRTCKVGTKCRLPTVQFKGRINYSETVLDAENTAHELLRQVEAKKAANGGLIPLGFDTEWKVVFRRGAQRRKVAVLQLCIDADTCHVFHVIHSGIPSPLKNILEDPLVSKVGVGAYGDAAKLCTDYNVRVKGVKDLSCLANSKLVGANKSWSLSSLAEELLGKQVDKTGSIRMGDWEVEKLSEAQLHYAATDAFASLYLFQVLLTFPDPQKEVLPDLGCST